ncbi:hypothetical protein D5018_02350 [Parashewanella curva]|uniref:Uncharacterized protein n=1 Tax=Parashewanella curva TaxID=2338552 RepID=A0A3L8Q2S6_9GAMM|nr:hypothetical protein [Parashewanella curva]RLV61339.1 hypothetical protein D5018_02350 [Parashewanella curva]
MSFSISNLAGSFSDPYAPSPVDDSSSFMPEGFNAEAAEPVLAVDWLVAAANQSSSPSLIPFDTATTGVNHEGLHFDSKTRFRDLCHQLMNRDDISAQAYYLCTKDEFLKGFIRQSIRSSAMPKYGEFVCDRLSECFLNFIQRFEANSPLMFGTCLFLNKFIHEVGIKVAIANIQQLHSHKSALIASQLARLALPTNYYHEKKYVLLGYALPLTKCELSQLSKAVTAH